MVGECVSGVEASGEKLRTWTNKKKIYQNEIETHKKYIQTTVQTTIHMQDEEETKKHLKFITFSSPNNRSIAPEKLKKGLWKWNWNNKKHLQTTTRVTMHMKKEEQKNRNLLPLDQPKIGFETPGKPKKGL